MPRRKDVQWNIGDSPHTWDEVAIAVLMDLRDELKGIRARLDYYETIAMPRYLRRIALAVEKPHKRRRKRKKPK